MVLRLIVLNLFLGSTIYINAQKKPLTTDDFAHWKRIEHRQISNNGKLIAYESNQQKGDGELIIHSIETNENRTIPLGYSARFSPNSDFIVYKYKPATRYSQAELKSPVKKNKTPEDSLGIYIFTTKQVKNFTKAKSFAVPKENASWVAVLLEHQITKPNHLSTVANTAADIPTPGKLPKKNNKEKKLHDLLVLNPITGTEYIFHQVEAYQFAKNGKTLGIVTKEKDSLDISTVIAFNTQTQTSDTIFREAGTVKNIAVDAAGNQLAFLFSNHTTNEKIYALNLANLEKNTLSVVVDTLTKGMPVGFAPSENGAIFFSDDATKLFMGTAQIPKKEPEPRLFCNEQPVLDLWSWTDIELQPMQLKNVKREKKRTYTALYRIADQTFFQIADTVIRNIRLSNKNNGEVALGLTNIPYKKASSWSSKRINDYYIIDLKKNTKKKILEGKSNVHLSPTGKFTVWYEQTDSSYYVINNKTNKITSLTKKLNIPFYNELNDMPAEPRIYGIAGWTENDEVLIYDRFDIWKTDLSGKKQPINITGSFGRNNKIRLRYINTNPGLIFIPSNKNVFLEGFDEINCQSGYYSANLTVSKIPVELIKGNFRVGNIYKAKDAETIIWSIQNVTDYPEIKVSDLNFKNAVTISQTNPQQNDFNWATTELVTWTSFTGEELRGILYKPENFDRNKKYPMLVYFYERNSESIHTHYTPYPSNGKINKTFYASNGYLVFVPDITYITGYPGQSAYNAVVSGTQYLTNTREFVDAQRIGLQGQSWGGYQIAYLITQTNMFTAAMAGAPVANMISAYGGIRWETGKSRMFQYEHTQSRIGATLWDKPFQYIENSPIFYTPKVNTPLLIMHNDNDGAVPWYQGIELFVALRRLNKPVWLINYNGMKHKIEAKYWANRIDYSNRMLQYFNHYLKEEPAPDWMINGIPAVEKGVSLGY